MKITDIIESREQCAEAGWYAYDFILENPLKQQLIYSLRSLGAFTFLPMLKKPFFKIESDHYLIKGMEQDCFFRVAVHRDYPEELNKIKKFLYELQEQG